MAFGEGGLALCVWRSPFSTVSGVWIGFTSLTSAVSCVLESDAGSLKRDEDFPVFEFL